MVVFFYGRNMYLKYSFVASVLYPSSRYVGFVVLWWVSYPLWSSRYCSRSCSSVLVYMFLIGCGWFSIGLRRLLQSVVLVGVSPIHTPLNRMCVSYGFPVCFCGGLGVVIVSWLLWVVSWIFSVPGSLFWIVLFIWSGLWLQFGRINTALSVSELGVAYPLSLDPYIIMIG